MATLKAQLQQLQKAIEPMHHDAADQILADFMAGLTIEDRERIGMAALGVNKQIMVGEFIDGVLTDSGFRWAIEQVAIERPSDVKEVGFVMLGGRAALSKGPSIVHPAYDITKPYGWTITPTGYCTPRPLTPDEVDAAIPVIIAKFKYEHRYDERREMERCGTPEEREAVRDRWWGSGEGWKAEHERILALD